MQIPGLVCNVYTIPEPGEILRRIGLFNEQDVVVFKVCEVGSIRAAHEPVKGRLLRKYDDTGQEENLEELHAKLSNNDCRTDKSLFLNRLLS